VSDDASPAPLPARTEAERRIRRKRLTILLIPIVAFTVAGTVVNLASPALIKHHPLVVIFFNPINRYLILAATKVGVWQFFAVGFIRLVLTDPLYFLLGRWFGDGALDWIENKTGNTGTVPFIKKWFGRAGPAFVFLAPNAYVCLLAGASGMNVPMFVGLNATGTIGRLILIKATGDVFAPILNPVVNFLDRYRWQFVVVSVVLFALQTAMNRKKGKSSEVESVGKMADELEASIDAAENE
jgi:membrane protein DedA with SNARE-associated domain